jgi:SAM-dependent methyltransferase
MKGGWEKIVGDSISCFLCASGSVKIARGRRPIHFNSKRFFYRCRECKGYSLWPKLEDSEIEKLYSPSYIGDVKSEVESKTESDEIRFDNLRVFLGKFDNPQLLTFLDYGCGANAENVIFARGIGFSSFGIEVAAETRKEASLISGCEIFCPEDLRRIEHKFDVVFLGDVIEHVSNPIEVLTSISQVTKPNGFIVIQGPLEGTLSVSNILVLFKGFMLRGRPSLQPPYHVSLATTKSMKKLFSNAGYVKVQLQISEPLWPAPKIGSKDSFKSYSKLILSITKLLDVFIHKCFPSYGTRFFCVLQSRGES